MYFALTFLLSLSLSAKASNGECADFVATGASTPTYALQESQNSLQSLLHLAAGDWGPLTAEKLGQVEAEILALRGGTAVLKGEASDVIVHTAQGQTVLGSLDRAILHRLGLLHRAAVCFVLVFPPNGSEPRVLVQEFFAPEPNGEVFIIGGHVKSGEGYEATIRREIVEELGLGTDHALGGRLTQVGKEGGFEISSPDGDNQERTSVYLYEASPAEAVKLVHYAQSLEQERIALGDEAFHRALAARQKDAQGRSTGLGEIRAIHFPTLERLLNPAGFRYHPELQYYLQQPDVLSALSAHRRH